MNRIDRLHAILTVLQTKRVVKAEELATRFEISIRTVYRDLRALEEGGVPLGAEAGVGYFLSEGYHIPPIMFTYQEGRSLLLAAKFVEKHTDAEIKKNIQSALSKIQAVLDTEKKDDLEGLDQKIIIDPFRDLKPSAESLNLVEIKEALSKNKVMKFSYKTIDEKISEREVEAIGVIYYASNWHLIAFCRMRKAYRDFRMDRIFNLKNLNETFLRIKHPSLKDYISKLIDETKMVKVTIQVHHSVLPFIQNSKYHMGLIEEERKGEFCEMTFTTYSLEYFARWVFLLGVETKIVSPPNLEEKLKELLEEWMDRFYKRR